MADHTGITVSWDSRPLKSSMLRVYSGSPLTMAVAAIRRSNLRGFGSRPAANTNAFKLPYALAAFSSNATGVMLASAISSRVTRSDRWIGPFAI